MRSTLLASSMLALTFLAGCDDAAKKEEPAATAPVVAPAAPETKGAMGGPAPEIRKADDAGAMAPMPTTPAPAPTTTPASAPEEKKEDMPK